jgi:hypothetical protein
MATEVAGWRKLTKAMTYHIIRDVNRDMAATIMHCDRMSNQLGKDRAGPAPGAQHFFIAARIHLFNFFQQLRADKRALF